MTSELTPDLPVIEPPADAHPAKAFFVNMLTRDIELKDAILDLLDNCVDGAMRSLKPAELSGPTPYHGKWAKISLSTDMFRIEDNCGGIPLELARKSAFRLGRADPDQDKDLPTVGIYGIGMKRAIFKLGRNATVDSKTSTDNFVVTIDDAWMSDDHLWTIPMKVGSSSLDVDGTLIEVSQLPLGISRLFSDETDFVKDLEKAIASYYSVILDKGFAVTVNTVPVKATQTAILMDSVDFEKSTGIMPYVYHAERNGVVVSVVIGFYRDFPDEEEQEQALEGKPSVEKAGITVVCNDRVVLYADKTRMTGWGEATVPGYHTQFVSIAGLVTFNANDASLLPVTTTKRGLDGNSELYLIVKENVREGIKFFTDFTNKWKNSKLERVSFQQKAQAVLPAMIAARVPVAKRSSVHKDKGIGGWKYKPQLPLPTEEDPMRQVRFSRKQSEIATVAKYLFDDVSIAPGAVGDKCFDDALKRAGKR